MKPATVAASLLLLLLVPIRAEDAETAFYPSDRIPDLAALRHVLTVTEARDPATGVSDLIFRPGRHELSDTLVVSRSGIRLRGSTGTLLESDASPVIRIQGAVGVTLQRLAVKSRSAGGICVEVRAIKVEGGKSFAEDIWVRRCRFEGSTGMFATARVRELTVSRCSFLVTHAGGVGVDWGDGPGLFVTRTRFETASGSTATAALAVRGRADPASEGDYPDRIILTRNRVSGDFAAGFDLSDVTDLRCSHNRISFPGPMHGAAEGRMGIRVCDAMSAEGPELVRNRVTRAHTGICLLGTAAATLYRNRVRKCGSEAMDTLFGDTGCAVRLRLPGTSCVAMKIRQNDFRGLRSVSGEPAVRVYPVDAGAACFGPDDRNRRDEGRPLHGLDVP